MNPLTNLDIIVTRPAAQAQLWRQQLQSLGAVVHAIPVLEIAPLDSASDQQQAKNTLLKLDEFQIGIFVSQNAVQYAAEWIDNFWPQHPIGIEYFAVGTATAKAAREKGFEVTAAEEAMNSETLLQLPALNAVDGKKVVIFRGRGGRPTLQTVLTERHASVTLCELYQRRLPPEATAQLNELNCSNTERQLVLTVHSGESLENLLSILSVDQRARWQTVPLLVPGERVAELAKTQGFDKVIVSLNATDQAMTEALTAWQAQ